MKKNEIATLILIVSICLVVGYFVGQSLLGDSVEQAVKVKTADSISSDVTNPDPKIFNKDAIDPTVPVKIGSGSNKPPFGQ